MKKFPQLIHVTVEGNNPPYFQVNERGVFDVEEPGKPIAIYKLVEVGTVQIDKRFIKKRKPIGSL